MAEYIDRNLIEWYGCDYENADCDNRECSGCSFAECSHSQVMQISTANVIERSKIDKAIEELQKEIEENHLNVINYADGEWITKDFIYGAIERLKRNIGE